MKSLVYGIKFVNRKNEFCRRSLQPYYFISHFRTDYLIEIDSTLQRGKAGDVYIAAPNTVIYHGPTPEMTDGFINDWIYIDGEELGTLLKKYPLPIGKPFIPGPVSYVSSAIERIHKEKSHAEVGYEEKCDLIITEAIIDLYRAYIKSGGMNSEKRIDYVRGEIMENYKKDWTLAEIAELGGYSVSRMCALYKNAYGTSPINDIIDKRIETAKLLMEYGKTPLSEIAEEVGFSSIYYFSKQFKKRVGMPPTLYRKKL